MKRDKGPERVRLEIENGLSVKVTFLGDERTKVHSNDVYVRADLYAKVLNDITSYQDQIYDLKEQLKNNIHPLRENHEN
jgi:hypothetical protein